jgi:phytanoyl-CoA hydroxylase
MQVKPRDFTDRSPYLWADLPDAADFIAAGALTSDPALLAHFATEGYAVISNAVAAAAITAFRMEVRERLEDPEARVSIEYWADDGKRREAARHDKLGSPEAKVLDLHGRFDSTHALMFAPPVLAFLRDVFGEEPVAFQSLYFEYGSQQGAHQDTAFVYVDPPYKMVASWTGLEDVVPDSGELFFYPRSHSVGEVRFANGSKKIDWDDPHVAAYSQNLEKFAGQFGLERRRFLAKRGDVLFWTNDLIHGGEPTQVRTTRRSFVTHYCPLNASVPYARTWGLEPQPIPGGGYVLSAT